ncbi:MAG: hypothetical protein NTV05_02145 [Acidobacteria bacterium]|nr:hypothetical protein [Acidobacteriota bacterium]
MNLSALTTIEIATISAVVVLVIAAIAMLFLLRKRRTGKLRSKFGGAEYDRAVKDGGNRRQAEAGLDKRTARVESFHLQPLAPAERERFLDAWRTVQARFVDGPAGAVADADRLLGEVMSSRGYPISEFAQRAADISVDHPVVLENYRTAHEIALRQAKGQASTEDLRQAMIHYRALFDELVSEPAATYVKVAS